ncbi:MAG: NFACT RNA binding domain-containing protein, partial [Gemmatimonadota bacterium]
VPLHRRATLGEAEVPPDDRVLTLEIASPGRSARQGRAIVVELMTNQWNALVLSRERRILAALHPRRTGDRALLSGHAYAAPEPTGRTRPEELAAWRAVLADVPPSERPGVLGREVAWASSLNAGPILGDAARENAPPSALDAAFERYARIAALPDPEPRLLRPERGPQPYPLPLPGVPGEPAPSLLDAMARAAEALGAPAAPAATGVAPDVLDRLRERVRRLDGRLHGLTRELEGARPEAEALRERADLLLSQLHKVEKGAERAVLDDFRGGEVVVDLDPALSPAENAERLYDTAQKRERAAERLPELIREAEAERDALGALLERAERGEADPEAVEAAAPPPPETGRRKDASEAGALPPYRRYATSSGLEVRVGRHRKANDDLTFHHSSPNDVWLHARDAAGSHVILRWNDPSANPPARDLLEAAVLAALNSRARTSGSVPVDWTRRKYVRKPRKAPPGLVVPDRVQTVFVEPDERLERRMRREG